ncbi:hypothetical protein EIO_2918 (plasmid) [Ketogulonicigenium vulgare Y25]|nr:hypothetical protein EIO_2918 [Ketogulonicigenium vulgare Y25]
MAQASQISGFCADFHALHWSIRGPIWTSVSEAGSIKIQNVWV